MKNVDEKESEIDTIFCCDYSFQVNALEIFLVFIAIVKQESVVVNPVSYDWFPSITTVSGNEIKMEGAIHMTGGEH